MHYLIMRKTYKMKVFITARRSMLKNVNFLNIMFTIEMRFHKRRKKFHHWKSLTKKV